jgi:excisionase family DNA binding protein
MSNAGMQKLFVSILEHTKETNDFIASLLAQIQNMETAAPVVVKQNAPKEIMSVKDVVEYTSLSESTIYQLVHAEKLPCHNPTGGRILFKRADIDKYILGGKQDASGVLHEMAEDKINRNAARKLRRVRK